MTHKEKQLLLDAAELIATRRRQYSCFAIFLSFNSDEICRSRLRDKYAKFYDKNPLEYWGINDEDWREAQNLRILMLLWFREVGLEGIGFSE